MKFSGENARNFVAGIVMLLVAACGERASENTPEIEKKAVAAVENPQMILGKRVFASCASCHNINAGGASTIGPNLAGVLGSTAGSKTDFQYSEALSAARVIWTEESLDSYIESPATFLPGGSMGFVGVADENDRKAVLAYLIAKTNSEGTDLSVPSDQGEDVAIWE